MSIKKYNQFINESQLDAGEEQEMPDLTNFDSLMNEIEDFVNSYRDGKAIAKRGELPNFYVVEFHLPSAGRGEAISIGGVSTGSGQSIEKARNKATKLAKMIESEIKGELDKIEDSDIDSTGNVVSLFMVSNEFAEQDRFSKKIINKHSL